MAVSGADASIAAGPASTGDAYRDQVLAALQGAARRGWLGPDPPARGEPTTNPAGDRVLRIDLLTLAIKTAVERVALPLSRAARALCDARAWSTFGYARVEDYARERLGRTGRWLRDQASLGRSLESFPALAAALAGTDRGRPLGKVSALWVGKVASLDSVEGWIALARRVSVRDLKESVNSALHERSAHEEQSDVDEHRRLSMALPFAIRTAFDETLCLHRAVSGAETSVASFIEALVAEAHAGLRPPDVDSVEFPAAGGNDAALEQKLAETTALWSGLRDRCVAGSEAALAVGALDRFQQLSRCAGRGDNVELDRQIRSLIELEDELERRLGMLLRELHDLRAWGQLRFAGLGHYAEQRLGLGRTAVESRVRVAHALQSYPRLRQAYQEGRLGLESVLLLVQILNSSRRDSRTEQAWVERAEEATVKRLRDELRALRRSQAGEEGGRHAFPLDDAAWHASLMLRPGEIRARVHDLGAKAVASGQSDRFLRLRLPEETAQGFLAAVESARRGLSVESSAFASSTERAVDGVVGGAVDRAAPASLRAARMFSARGQIVPSWVGLLALLEDFVDTWDLPEASPSRRADDVYAREGWRCFAPGCTSRKNLEDHHLVYRSRGGDAKDPANRICLCAFHHRRGEHGFLARCRGQAPLGVLWRLGRREVGVWFRNERVLDASHASNAC